MPSSKVITKSQEKRPVNIPVVSVGACIVGAFENGPLHPTMVADGDQFLARYTKNNTLPLDAPVEYFSALIALRGTKKLWCRRVVNKALCGGVMAGKGQKYLPFFEGYEDPEMEFPFKDYPKVNIIFYNKYPSDQEIAIEVQVYRKREVIADMVNYFNATTEGEPVVFQPEQKFVENERIKFVFDTEGIVLHEAKPAMVTGDADLTGGHDWSSESESFTVAVNKADPIEVVLSASCANLNEVIAEINNQLSVYGVSGLKAVPADNNFVRLETELKSKAAMIKISGPTEKNALTTLGIEADTYLGESQIISKVSKIGNVESGKVYFARPTKEDGKYNLSETYNGDLVPYKKSEITETIEGSLEPIVIIQDEETFILKVYTNKNYNVPAEQHICSIVKGKVNGMNENIFIENVLGASNYLSAKVSPLKPEDVKSVEPLFEAIDFVGGSNGETVSVGDRVKALKDFESKEYKFKVVMNGGSSDPVFHKACLDLCKLRNDCVTPITSITADETSSDRMNKVINYRRYKLNGDYPQGVFYSGHVQVFDAYHNRKIYVPLDGPFVANLCSTVQNYEIWYPVAGNKRGQIDCLDARIYWREGEMDELVDNQVNPIWFEAGGGIKFWGQKTLRPYTSFKQNLHVVFLEQYINEVIVPQLEVFLWELNNDDTRRDAKSIVDAVLTNVEARDGVYGFICVCDKSNNPDTGDLKVLYIDLLYSPQDAVETIIFRTTMTSAGNISVSVLE